MTTYTVQTAIRDDKKLRLEIPCELPAGPVEVLIVVQPQSPPAKDKALRWDDLYGVGKDVWQGIDALEYVRELREDRDIR